MSKINVGDKVHWTKTSSSGRTITMQRKEGTVQAIKRVNGWDIAIVKTPGRKVVEVPVTQLRLDGEKGQLTEFVEAVVEANRQ